MRPNPFLRKLGFSDTDRVVILHADDIGMCQSTVTAFEDLVDFGVLSSAAMMTPCPWFPAAAEVATRLKDRKPDVGVHMTLTAEWTVYRWGAVSTADPNTGLFDADGYFPQNTDRSQPHATTAAVDRELRAQLDRALALGLDVTHIDSHMLTTFTPAYLPIYLGLALEYRLPAFAFRHDETGRRADGFDGDVASEMARVTTDFEARGLPLFDHAYCMSLDRHEERLSEATRALADCPPGLTHFIIHPVSDTPEIRAIAPDWRARVADRALFVDEAWRAAVKASGVQVIGYRALRDALRAA